VEMVRTFPGAPWAPAAARRMIDMSAAESPRSFVQVARVLASELVTNALYHAPGSAIEVRVNFGPGRPVRIEVRDTRGGFEPEIPSSPDGDLESGWGLYLVNHLASRWGVEQGTPCCVWAEMDVDAA
jgi:anti-sigma regulatory factor (Ser/Thr protein kinase)